MSKHEDRMFLNLSGYKELAESHMKWNGDYIIRKIHLSIYE